MGADFRIDGQVAIVTGASRGIGEAIARALSAQGAHVVLASRKIEADFAKTFPSAHAVQTHTGSEDGCKTLVAEAVKHFGKVDILVNNAATNPYFGPMLQIPNSAWDKTFDVNVKGYFWMMREVANHLIARGAPGSLVSIASIAGLTGSPMQAVYAMTKASILSMTKTLAIELAPSKIRVNAIAPGFVDTKFSSAIVGDADLIAEVKKRTPQARYATPDEIAGAAVYLASNAASFMTGQTMVVDGGITVNGS
jgi:NAD(P)-dependent dehydrogenase (short-subunit alcohol dehydrogenase family)